VVIESCDPEKNQESDAKNEKTIPQVITFTRSKYVRHQFPYLF
jgi:hypothetical protein